MDFQEKCFLDLLTFSNDKFFKCENNIYLFIFRLMNEFTLVKDPFGALPVQKILLIEVTTTVIENSVPWDVKNQSLQVPEWNSKILNNYF